MQPKELYTYFGFGSLGLFVSFSTLRKEFHRAKAVEGDGS